MPNRVKAAQFKISEISEIFGQEIDFEGMTSERWDNKNPYLSFLHKNNDLTIILVPKYLEEKSAHS